MSIRYFRIYNYISSYNISRNMEDLYFELRKWESIIKTDELVTQTGRRDFREKVELTTIMCPQS